MSIRVEERGSLARAGSCWLMFCSSTPRRSFKRSNPLPGPFSHGLRSGVELKGCPVKRIAESAVAEQRQFGGAKSGIRTLSAVDFVIKLIHQLLGGNIRCFPQGCDHIVGAGSEESPRASDQALARVRALAGAVAR